MEIYPFVGTWRFILWIILIPWHVYFSDLWPLSVATFEEVYMHVVWMFMRRRSIYFLNIHCIHVCYRLIEVRCYITLTVLEFSKGWTKYGSKLWSWLLLLFLAILNQNKSITEKKIQSRKKKLIQRWINRNNEVEEENCREKNESNRRRWTRTNQRLFIFMQRKQSKKILLWYHLRVSCREKREREKWSKIDYYWMNLNSVTMRVYIEISYDNNSI